MKIREHIKFSITLAVLPWIPAFLLYNHNHFKLALIVLGIFILFSVVCFSFEKFANELKHTLDKIGSFLGKYIAIVALFICYILAVLPTGFLMKIIKRDRLRLKKPKVDSYWIDCKDENIDYEFQF